MMLGQISSNDSATSWMPVKGRRQEAQLHVHTEHPTEPNTDMAWFELPDEIDVLNGRR